MTRDALLERKMRRIDEAWMTVAMHFRDRAETAEAELAKLRSEMAAGHVALVSPLPEAVDFRKSDET